MYVKIRRRDKNFSLQSSGAFQNLRIGRRWIISGAVAVAIIAIVVVSTFAISYEGAPNVTTSLLSSPTVNPTFATPIRHIIVIVMENHEYSDVIGSGTGAPYQNYLASKYALATQYYAVAHPSLPNYFALIAGSTLGISSDCQPSQCSQSGKSVVDLLNQAGFSWKEYAESMPTNCSQTVSSDNNLYYPKHVPFVYFTDITGNRGSGKTSSYCQSRVVPFGEFYSDLGNNSLPNYAFVTPNVCNDSHNCGLTTGDNWLAGVVPKIINSPEFNSTVLFIVYDEGATNLGANGSQGGGHVACIVVSPFVKTDYKSTVRYSHYSLLATVEAIYNLGSLGRNDASAPTMQDLFSIKIA
jgi:phospholipase C